jgi:hypothetical protein
MKIPGGMPANPTYEIATMNPFVGGVPDQMFSSGPMFDLTPKDHSPIGILDQTMTMTPYGPPYGETNNEG